MRVILGLLVWSLVEIGLFVAVGGAIGVWATWGVVLGSAVLGVAVLRRAGEGQRMRAVQVQDLAGPLAQGVLRGLAGVLLILPGFLTDALGLALLVPAVRGVIIARIVARVGGVQFRGAQFRGGFAPSEDVIDGEAVEVPQQRVGPPSGWTKDHEADR